VVDRRGLPVRLALSTGEAHDNRLATKLLYQPADCLTLWGFSNR
jgi:hypothetical protein